MGAFSILVGGAPAAPANAANLRESRKADRQIMADAIATLGAYYGCEVNRELRGITDPADFQVHLSLNGLCATFDFERRSCQPDVFVTAWHIDFRSAAKLSRTFGYIAGGEVNPHHWGKCTTVQHGFAQLYEITSQALAYAATGQAFQPAEVAA